MANHSKPCRTCDTALLPGANHCPVCGAKVMALNCPSCQSSNPETSLYCLTCGINLQSETLPQPPNSTADARKRNQVDVQIENKRCSQCSESLESWQKFCVNCGTKVLDRQVEESAEAVEEIKTSEAPVEDIETGPGQNSQHTCSNCSESLESWQKFCMNCGAQVNDEPAEEAVSFRQQEDKPEGEEEPQEESHSKRTTDEPTETQVGPEARSSRSRRTKKRPGQPKLGNTTSGVEQDLGTEPLEEPKVDDAGSSDSDAENQILANTTQAPLDKPAKRSKVRSLRNEKQQAEDSVKEEIPPPESKKTRPVFLGKRRRLLAISIPLVLGVLVLGLLPNLTLEDEVLLAPIEVNCETLYETFPGGVGRAGAVNRGEMEIKAWAVSDEVYQQYASLDTDLDGIACERVTLNTEATSSEAIVMPDLIGFWWANARLKLEKLGVNFVSQEVCTHRTNPGYVSKTSPLAGSEVSGLVEVEIAKWCETEDSSPVANQASGEPAEIECDGKVNYFEDLHTFLVDYENQLWELIKRLEPIAMTATFGGKTHAERLSEFTNWHYDQLEMFDNQFELNSNVMKNARLKVETLYQAAVNLETAAQANSASAWEEAYSNYISVRVPWMDIRADASRAALSFKLCSD